MYFVHYGTAGRKALEPKLERLWKKHSSEYKANILDNLDKVSKELSRSIKPKYPIVKDIAQSTGI